MRAREMCSSIQPRVNYHILCRDPEPESIVKYCEAAPGGQVRIGDRYRLLNIHCNKLFLIVS